MPRLFVLIAGFMYRYLFVIVEEARRDARRAGVARLRPAARAAGGADRAGRDGAVPAHVRARRARPPGDARARLRAARCPQLDAAALRRADVVVRRRCVLLALVPLRDPGGGARELRGPRARRSTYRYPDGRPALDGVDLHVGHGERVARARAQRRRQDDADAAPQRPAARRRAGSRWRGSRSGATTLRELRARVGLVFQDPDDQLFMPTVREDVAFGPLNLGLDRARCARRRGGGARAPCGWRTPPTARRTSSRWASAGGSRSRPCWRCARRCSCSTSRRPTSTRARGASCSTSSSASSRTMLVVTHDLPLAAELCERAVDPGRRPRRRRRPLRRGARRRGAAGRARPRAAGGLRPRARRAPPAPGAARAAA